MSTIVKTVRQTAVVIPAYNEAATIRSVAAGALRHDVRVIVVDDGSTDGTGRALDGLPVTVLRQERNRGKAAALWRGMAHAREQGAKQIVTLDGDGQHDPDEIPRLVAAAVTRPRHVVVAVRSAGRSKAPRLRRFANRFADFWLSWSCGQALADCQSGYRLYPAELVDGLRLPVDREHGFVFESEILIEAAWRGFPVCEVPVASVYRAGARPSHFRHRDTWRITRMVAGRLLRRGLYLRGLVRAYLWPQPRGRE